MVLSANLWKTPVTLLTGFLGAGKTTLLNRILQGEHGQRFAVLVNDFGSLNIDQMLIQNVEGNVITLEGGCVCCVLKNDLANSLLQILLLRPDHILIEVSGVANPYPILQTLKRQVLSKSIRLENIISLVDVTYFPQICETNDKINYQDLLIDQISVADIVILNKIDLASSTEKTIAHQLVRKIAPWARLLEASYADVPLDLLLGLNNSWLPHTTFANSSVDHSKQFQTWSYQSDRSFSLLKLRQKLSQLPVTVLRAKGVLFANEHPKERVILQQVGPRINLEIGDPWDNTNPCNQLVLIGLEGSLNIAQLQHNFDNCLIPTATAYLATSC
jgi:G3E family GTPase